MRHDAPPAGGPQHAVQACALGKAYAGVPALQQVDFCLAPGEIRALLGKNGAGKSTLLRILAGAHAPDSGTLHVGGRRVAAFTPRDARALGVAMVHQELSLVPALGVAENILLGRWRRGRLFVDHAAMRREAAAALAMLGAAIDPALPVRRLSIAQQQMVEIARALSLDPRVLILDEPTSSLSAADAARLLGCVRTLAARGVAVIYVSHRMDEIQQVADSVTVLRDGRHVGTVPIAQAPTAEIVRLMTGRTAAAATRPAARTPGPVALEVRGLSTRGKLRGVSLDVHAGEIVGLAGLLGAGRTELLRAVYGLDPAEVGEVSVRGEPVVRRSPARMIGHGVGLAPEDRKKDGLVLGMGIAENLVLASPARVMRGPWLSRTRQSSLARHAAALTAVKCASLDDPVRSLSGGNQQKVVLGKWLNAGVQVLLLDEPTRGVDIDAKHQIYDLLRALAAQGTAVLVASSEPEELMALCDRLLVMKEGAIVARREVHGTTLAEVMALAMGEHVHGHDT